MVGGTKKIPVPAHLVGKEGVVLAVRGNGWLKLAVGSETLEVQQRYVAYVPAGGLAGGEGGGGGTGGYRGAGSGVQVVQGACRHVAYVPAGGLAGGREGWGRWDEVQVRVGPAAAPRGTGPSQGPCMLGAV